MADNLTLIDFIRELLGLEGESKAIELRDFYQQNPQAALNEYGLGHLSPEDVQDAMVLVQDNDTVSFDRNYDTGSNWSGSTWGGSDGKGTESGQVREHVTDHHVTNNYDDRDTILDQSVNQNVDTHGGSFDQSIVNDSVNATGEGSVAAGDDIRDSNVVTGDDNVAGNGNQVVQGDGNTTAFGEGSAVSDVQVDDGAFSVNGPASANNSTNDSYNKTHVEQNQHTDIDDSFNVTTDNSTDTHIVDDSHTDIGSHNDLDLHFG